MLREKFSKQAPESYSDLFKSLIDVLLVGNEEDWSFPNKENTVVIDHGHYQGTQLFIVSVLGYQPDEYFACKVSYGSCSACDTFQRIQDSESWDLKAPTERQVDDYMILALQMVEGLKEI